MAEPVNHHLLSPRFMEALQLAHDLHATQARKGGTIPYLSHLICVAGQVLKMGGSEDQAIAALLHDAVEDQGDKITFDDIQAKFGAPVADMVRFCTDETGDERESVPWMTRKQRYLAHMAQLDETSMLVLVADKLDNIRDMVREYHEVGDQLWQRFTGRKDGMLWYLARLADEMQAWGAQSQHHQAKCLPLMREFMQQARALVAKAKQN